MSIHPPPRRLRVFLASTLALGGFKSSRGAHGLRRRGHATGGKAFWFLLLVTFPLAGCVEPPLAPGVDADLLPITLPDDANPIQRENLKAGFAAWGLDPVERPEGVAAYAAPFSVEPGERVSLRVSTIHDAFGVEVYRLGWYGGQGSRFVGSLGRFDGIDQGAARVVNASTGLVSAAHWMSQASIDVNATWTSGLYVAKITTDDDAETAAVFVVRAAPDAPRAPLVYHTADLTWQAYNRWGGTSLYQSTVAGYGRAQQVSYDRPDEWGLPIALTRYELPIVQLIEREGIWVDYASDVDLHERPAYFEGRTGLVTNGHSEYWSGPMVDLYASLRENGTNHAVFSGNTMYWQVRIDDSPLGSGRVITCFKSRDMDPFYKHTPALTTVRFRDPAVGRPEHLEIGLAFAGANKTNVFDLHVTDAAQQVWKRAPPGGSTIRGVVSHEWDWYPAATPPSYYHVLGTAQTFFTNGTESSSIAVVYRDPEGGGLVFNAGGFGWGYALAGQPAWGVEADPLMRPWLSDIIRLIGGDTSVLNNPFP